MVMRTREGKKWKFLWICGARKKLFDFSDVANEKNELVPSPHPPLFDFCLERKINSIEFRWWQVVFDGFQEWNYAKRKNIYLCVRWKHTHIYIPWAQDSRPSAEWLIAFICGIKMNIVAGTIMKFFINKKRNAFLLESIKVKSLNSLLSKNALKIAKLFCAFWMILQNTIQKLVRHFLQQRWHLTEISWKFTHRFCGTESLYCTKFVLQIQV